MSKLTTHFFSLVRLDLASFSFSATGHAFLAFARQSFQLPISKHQTMFGYLNIAICLVIGIW
jgi:hypothetical protein